MSRDAHEIECAQAAYATLIERARTHTEKRRLRKELHDYEASYKPSEQADVVLAHKRALKAAQMRKYRAKKTK